jgi:surface polysaccharide O-acyltransferase-like enzyme
MAFIHQIGNSEAYGRNSSIELYRIIATFTVLIVHFNGWFVGGIQELDYNHPTLQGIGQIVIESSSIICVNMFLIISGYFGIHLKLKSVIRLCSLLALIYVPFYIIETLWGGDFSIKGLIGRFFVITNAGYFIQGYLMLMFFSPALNSFVEKYKNNTLPWVMLFICIEYWFDTIRGVEFFGFNRGYSIIHFLLIYMVARCISLYKERLLIYPRVYWLYGYVVSTIIICFMFVGGLECTFSYSNPVVIISSVCTFMPFLYKEWHNRYVNWVAGGTLGVYIIQVTDPVYSLLVKIDNYFLDNFSYPLYLFYGGIVILLTFLLAVAYYKVCETIVNPFINKLPSLVNKCEYR